MSLRISPPAPDGVSSPAVSVERGSRRRRRAARVRVAVLDVERRVRRARLRVVELRAHGLAGGRGGGGRARWRGAVRARFGRLLELAGSLVVIAVLVRAFRDGDFVRGPALAALGTLLVIAAAPLESAPAGVRRRLARRRRARPPVDGCRRARRSPRGRRRAAARRPATALHRARRAGGASRPGCGPSSPSPRSSRCWSGCGPPRCRRSPPRRDGRPADVPRAAAHPALAHMDFGTQIVWTYGPLGYLTVPRVVSVAAREQAMLGYAYMTVAYWALAADDARHRAARSVGVVLAFVAALSSWRRSGHGRDEQTQFAIAAMAYGWAYGAARRAPARVALVAAPPGGARRVRRRRGAREAQHRHHRRPRARRGRARHDRGLAAPGRCRGLRRGFAAGLVGLWLALDQSLSALDHDRARPTR